MRGAELLKEYPKASDTIRKWFIDKMLESLKDSELVGDFKEYLDLEWMNGERVSSVIDSSPRSLFDFFDKNHIYILIGIHEDTSDFLPQFEYKIGDQSGLWYSCRKDAEKDAIEEAFRQLEEQL